MARALSGSDAQFAGVDAVEIDRRHAEVAVAELALDHLERDTFAGHLDGVRLAQLVGAKRRRTPAFVETRRASHDWS